ncbi:MAG TPA: ScyD/ScyE family protein [Steroidobacteraceae bacterium]
MLSVQCTSSSPTAVPVANLHAPLRWAFLAVAALGASLLPAGVFAQQPSGFAVIATGLEAPRGLRFGPDGELYVAEAGTGGSQSTAGKCQQVPVPVGPYTGGSTGRVSKISKNGTVTTVASGFPSTQDAMGDLIGVADVAFLGNQLYALVAGGGCSHGNPTSPSGVAKVDRNTGKWSLVADVGAFLKSHPAKYESVDDFEPDGTLYSMIPWGGSLYAVEPNHGQVLSVTPGGTIAQVLDVSASQGHIVPTAIAEGDGAFYVGNLNLFPIDPQWARILTFSKSPDDDRLAPGFSPRSAAHILNSKAGFTTVVAVDFGPDGLLYVLELSDAAGFPTPGAGKVVRVKHSGEIEDVVTQLNVPTGMTFGPDTRLYISDFGAVPAPAFGIGRILRFDVAPGW